MRKLTETNLRKRRRQLKKIDAMIASGEWDWVEEYYKLEKAEGLLGLINNGRNSVSHVSEGSADENSVVKDYFTTGYADRLDKSKLWFVESNAEDPENSLRKCWFVPVGKRGELAVSVKNIIDEWDLNYTMAEVIKHVHAASLAQDLQERLLQTENALNLIREEVEKVKKRIKLFNN